MRCLKCTEENPDGTRFCRRCGAAMPGASSGGKGKWIVLAVLAAIGALLFFMVSTRHSSFTALQAPTPVATPDAGGPKGDTVSVGVAYGTEKRDWLNWAVDEFAKTPEAANIHIDLKPMGSLEAAHSIVKNDKGIQVWSPASSLYKDAFVNDWKGQHGDANPIEKEAPLALTPMVFVMWEARYEAFMKHYKTLDFRTIGQAMDEKAGWAVIANRPEWMFFKFSHTDPEKSNSGLMTLVLMGCDYHGKHAGLNGRDITDTHFQDWMESIERGLSGAASGLVASTGDLMTTMVQRGPSTYDVIYVYESVAINRLRQASGRWGPLKVVYPDFNMWNDNPYYILDVPWSSIEQRKAAKVFLDFLLTERVQQKAMESGFRPANVQVPTNGPDSPFVKYQSIGFRPDVPAPFASRREPRL